MGRLKARKREGYREWVASGMSRGLYGRYDPGILTAEDLTTVIILGRGFTRIIRHGTSGLFSLRDSCEARGVSPDSEYLAVHESYRTPISRSRSHRPNGDRRNTGTLAFTCRTRRSGNSPDFGIPMSIIHSTRRMRPRPCVTPQPETTHHQLRRVYPAAIQFLRQAAATSGFGTAAGTTRERMYGYKTRSPRQFLNHLEGKATIIPGTSFQSPRPLMTHRFMDTADHSRVFICSRSHDFTSLSVMQEHVRYADSIEEAGHE